MILGFADYASQGRQLAEALDRPLTLIDIHRFPDGESKVTVPVDLPPQVVICRSLDQPNAKLVELMLAAETARREGARHLTLVAPYLCYMRQDIAFAPGEAVSQRIVGDFLARLFDAVVTVDPHLHRIDRLEQAIPCRHALAPSAAPAMAAFLAERGGNPLLVGPDDESDQWVEAIAAPAGLEHVVAHKERHGDKEVVVQLPEADYAGREVVLVDDIASTGRTLAVVAGELRARGADPIHCLVTHPLFVGDALATVQAAGVSSIWSSDSITHPSNRIPLAGLLADAVRSAEA